ncbi:threonine aldolase family protein [Tenacibaculum sp. nBUS_03]|uniref:threonine aldolase family protein n=1 Tax=Tenacibaculum sp. nBUS_03 TaxID=3395320 RepID=UPI003EB9E1FD
MNFKRTLASDNYSGVLPEMIEAITKANNSHAKAYGYDDITEKTKQLFREIFNHPVEVAFVFNGTGANVLSLSLCTNSFNSVLCARSSHLYEDESTAPETFTGCRFIPLDTDSDGKVSIETLKSAIVRKGDEHHPQAKVFSIAQPTEYGTIYTLKELEEISEILRENDMLFHVDGARLFNAAVSLNCSLSELTKDVGVDILSLGGTKVGMMFGEAVVCFNNDISKNLKFRHKQTMQLPSKTRFIAAQFHELLINGIWKTSAKHSNEIAKYLRDKIFNLVDSQIKITRTVQANAVFAIIPKQWNETLMEVSPFYVWDEFTNEVRWMCSFDTKKTDIDNFLAKIKELDSR